MNTKRYSQRLREVVLLFFILIIGGYIFSSCTSQIQEKPQPESSFKPLIPEVPVDEMTDVDFTKFSHTERHAGVPCLLCHQRNEESPKPRFSSHQTCAGCHTEQFKDKTHAICLTCHSNVDSGELKPFPPLRTFKMKFDHAAHFKETNCATCHKTEGVGMTVPAGSNAHATCFQCHTTDKIVGEKNIGSCNACHEAGKPNRVSDVAKNIGFNFEHSNHSSMNCQSCHAEAAGNKMSAINVSMHSGAKNSCTTCHNGGKAFGANVFTDCKRCHTEVASARSFGVKFDHGNHSKTNCATCHKSGGNGVSFTVPNGQAAHNNCFQCHSPMKGGGSFTSSKCFQCHVVGSKNDITPSARSIEGNFSHTKHNAMDCKSCHNSSGGNMKAPAVVMHKATKSGLNCATCHNNQKAFGEDFTNCRKCHTNGNFKF